MFKKLKITAYKKQGYKYRFTISAVLMGAKLKIEHCKH